VRISDTWPKVNSDSMCAKRELTEDEVDRAIEIGRWFKAWGDTTGPCPICITNESWHQKLCALFEWIAVLESNKSNKKNEPMIKEVE
jgi:hypothetical protein